MSCKFEEEIKEGRPIGIPEQVLLDAGAKYSKYADCFVKI